MRNLDVEALRSFVDDNEDLEQLETILDRFNLFESLGLVRQEIRHSAFIRWFLDPSETHGLGDFPLRQFLRRVIKAGEEHEGDLPSLFDLDDWNLGEVEIRKEWRNIDLLILDEDNRFVCTIENKVDSGEGPDQLPRYKRTVKQAFGEYKRVFVFLTKSGDPPSDEAYIRMSYVDLASIIESTLKRRESQVNDEIKLFVQQYLDMVRRHIVQDSDVQELCRRLYRNHRRALDLIFEHRPDRATEVAHAIQDYIKSQDALIPLYSAKYNPKSYIRFLPQGMDVLPCEGTEFASKRVLYWLLDNKNGKVRFKLELGQGSPQIREQVYEKAKSLPGIFGPAKRKLSPEFHTLFSEDWITQKEYAELDDEGIGQRVGERIEDLLKRKGDAIADALKELA